jgi:hypothetical protein
VKELPETATAAWACRLREGSVIQGVKEGTLIPVRLKVWLLAEPPPLMATMT